ncbi:hypothetical protein QFZ67_001705 [Streptomyces sp. V1I1]|nr:hypothetical protein [Streptomyces sp. V1I1]
MPGVGHSTVRDGGLRLTTPDGRHTHRLPVVEGPQQLGELREDDVLVLAAGIEAAGEEEQIRARAEKVRLEPLCGSERGGGSSWQSLNRGTGTIEADYLNGEIALLGRLHGVPTPVNDVLQRVANSFARERRAAGSMSVAELTALVDAEMDQ